MKKLTVLTLLVMVHVACLGGGGSRPQVSAGRPSSSPLESALQGQWELVSLEAQGQPRAATGQFSFDEFNNVAIRAELAPGEAGVTPPRVVLLDFSAKASVGDGQLSYVGLERRSPPEQMVPTASEPGAWRHFAVEGDSLRVWQEANGAPVGVLTFRRVR